MSEAEKSLAPYRAQIDKIDAQMAALLAERLICVEKATDIKHALGLPARTPGRIEAILTHVRQLARQQNLHEDLAVTVWRALTDWLLAYETQRLTTPPSSRT